MQRTLQKSPGPGYQQVAVDPLRRNHLDESPGHAGQQMGLDFQNDTWKVATVLDRTDDAIKNKFFSKFRKAARNINSLRCQTKNFKIKTLKIPFLYKLINFVDKTSRAQPSPTEELPLLAQSTLIYIKISKTSSSATKKSIIKKSKRLCENWRISIEKYSYFVIDSKAGPESQEVEKSVPPKLIPLFNNHHLKISLTSQKSPPSCLLPLPRRRKNRLKSASE